MWVYLLTFAVGALARHLFAVARQRCRLRATADCERITVAAWNDALALRRQTRMRRA